MLTVKVSAEECEDFIGWEIHALELLNRVGQHCVRPGNHVDGCLAVIVEAAIALTNADKCTVQVFDDSIGALKLVAHRGFEQPFLEFFDVVTTQGSVCELAMKSRTRVVVPDVTTSELLAGTPSLEVLLDAKVRAVQSTPLISSSAMLLGMISTHYRIPTTPKGPQLTLMDLLARQTADYLERKQVERELIESEEELWRFVSAVPTGMTRCSRDLRYVAANPAYGVIAGLPLDRIIGKPIIEVMGVEAFETILPRIQRVLRGERVEYEEEVPFSLHGRRYLHVVYVPEKDEQGEVAGWIASVTDMTEFRETRERLAKVERLAAAGQLAASLAHEINNPLSATMNCLYLLQNGNTDGQKARSLLDTASNELARVGRIVNQSLSYYRAGSVAQEIDMARVVRDSLQIFDEKFRHAGIQVTLKVGTVPMISGYPDEMRQVIDNLLLNAVEAMPKGGALAVALRSWPLWFSGTSGVRLTIADNGCGMTSTVQNKIFEPFFTTKAEKGTGLGLWVVKGILSKHGATIRLRSSSQPERAGTVVTILCPTKFGDIDLPQHERFHLNG